MAAETISPFLVGNFGPVHEEIEADDLPVRGELPVGLSGMFVRTGPNPQFNPIGRYHWFDGDGMLHGVRIKDGRASYRNRFVRTRRYEAEREAEKALYTGLAEPRLADGPPDPRKRNTANTALVWHDGRLLSLWEAGTPYHVTVPGLATVGPYDYCGGLVSAFTAHPKVDDLTGEMMFFGYSPAIPPHLQYSVVSREGELLRTVPIEIPRGVMMHDFAITERYTIFMDLPLTFSLERIMRGEMPFAFERDLPSRFGILPRHGDNAEVRWFEAPACYVFHTLNAFEDGDDVVLDACRMTTTNVLGPATRPTSPDSEVSGADDDVNARLHRWRFNLSTGGCTEQALDDIPSDFPRVDDRLLGRRTRYGYTARMARRDPAEAPLFDALIKYDLTSGRSDVHDFGPGRFGGEGVFVPRPDGRAEDDGWLLSFVYDTTTGASDLVVLDARHMTGPPVARVAIPQRVPYGFHGAWVTEEQIAGQRSSS